MECLFCCCLILLAEHFGGFDAVVDSFGNVDDVVAQLFVKGVEGAIGVANGKVVDAELKGGAFLDAENIRRIEANPEMELIRREDDIAHAVFESYCENLRATGEQPDYETFGQQPADLQQSCYGQAADLCEKVSRLGYRLVRADQAGEAASQIALDETQIEAMARWEHERWLNERRSMGWMFGQERDAEKKTSPYLVPYDELDEDVKEARNRAPMRDALKVLAGAGLAIVKV